MALSETELNAIRDRTCLSPLRASYGIFKGYVMPGSFSLIQQPIEDFEVYDDDIWVTSFPKCGTTWTQEIVWCLRNDLNFEAAKENIDTRFPFIEFKCMYELENYPNTMSYVNDSVNYSKNMKRPRFIKSHLPWDLLPKQIRTFERRPKIIHVMRDPKDACISRYHHSRLIELYSGNFEEFWQLSINDKLSYCPMPEVIRSYHKHRQQPNVLLIKFEDLKSNISSVVDQIAAFLDVSLGEEEKPKLLHHISFDVMKNNPFVSHGEIVEFMKDNNLIFDSGGKFIRSGATGQYTSEMSKEVIGLFDDWIKRKFKGTGMY